MRHNPLFFEVKVLSLPLCIAASDDGADRLNLFDLAKLFLNGFQALLESLSRLFDGFLVGIVVLFLESRACHRIFLACNDELSCISR